MELPDLVRESLGEEDVVAGVRLGDEDVVVFTPTRTVLYRGEGLLSDEGITTYPFDFERLQANRGRRKVSFAMEYMDGERDFSVPKDHGDRVLEHLIEGRLRVSEVVEPEESVTGVFRFSELTLVVTEGRLLKHVGEYTWDGDFEVFDFDDLTKLDFEEGSVATQVVLGTGAGRTDRIKAPNQQAGVVRKALQEAVFEYHDVDSLDALNREIEPEDADETPDAEAGLGLDAGIDPLVGEADDRAEGAQPPADPGTEPGGQADGGAGGQDANRAASSGNPDPGGARSEAGGARSEASGHGSDAGGARSDAGDPDSNAGGTASRGGGASEGAGESRGDAKSANAIDEEFEWPEQNEGSSAAVGDPSVGGGSDRDLQAITDQLAELTQEVERHNELLYRQQQTVEKLIEELKQGR